MAQHALLRIEHCTLGELINLGADYLEHSGLVFGHGTDNPMDEAAWLALEACGLSPVEPVDNFDELVNKGHLARAKNWFCRRAEQREPVAYITGRAWFAGLEFAADTRALIPRSPIAELILNEYQPWVTEAPESVLDLCCGGGCIAIASALALPEATVHASDISTDALALAAVNVQKHGVGHRLSLFEADLFTGLPLSQRYDLIVSNPPYVDKIDMHDLAPEYQHEPELGLTAGNDGLDIVTRIVNEAAQHLTPNGVLIVEVGNSQPAVEHQFNALDMVWLEFEMGGAGVFMTTAAALNEYNNR